MDIHTLYIIAYATSTTSSLGSCAILLFLNYGNIETNPVYLKARRILAFATFLVAIGLLISLTTRKWQPVGWDIASFPVTLIASSQTLLFTFSLILLFNEQYATRQRILLHATPSLLFTLAYAGACLIWKDHPVYAYSEWKSLVTNPPSLIRTLYLLAYIIQSGIYAKLFLHERHTYLSLLGGVKTEDRWLKLGQVTSAFFLASGIGLCTLSLALNPYLPHEITVTFLFTVFYFAFGIFYANFSSTYRDVRTRIREQNSAFSPPAGADMEELICYLQPDDDNNRLFKDIEAYFQKEQPYLDPDFRISDLPRTIGANPHKLSTAVGRATGLTVQDYVLRLRIGHSADLLLLPENAERTIEDIAFSSGFQSTSTYNRNFLKLMKTPPSRFRSRTREEHPCPPDGQNYIILIIADFGHNFTDFGHPFCPSLPIFASKRLTPGQPPGT